MTVCEIKYLQSKVNRRVIEQMDRQLELLPNPKRKTLHKVLITNMGAQASLISEPYFDTIITLDDLFAFWK